MNTLRIGERFPELEVDSIPDGRLQLPQALAGSHAVILFYRGRW